METNKIELEVWFDDFKNAINNICCVNNSTFDVNITVLGRDSYMVFSTSSGEGVIYNTKVNIRCDDDLYLPYTISYSKLEPAKIKSSKGATLYIKMRNENSIKELIFYNDYDVLVFKEFIDE